MYIYRHQGCFGRLEAADHLLPRDSANLPSFVTLRLALARWPDLSLTSTLSSHLLPRSTFSLTNLPRLTRQTCLRGLGRETRLPQGESELGLWVSYLLPTTTRSLPLTRPQAPSLTLGLLPPLVLKRKPFLAQQIQALFEIATMAFWPDSHLTAIS